MARGERSENHPNRQVGRKVRSYGWHHMPSDVNSPAPDTFLRDMADNPNAIPISVGSQKSDKGGYNSIIQYGGDKRNLVMSTTGNDAFRTRWGATRNAKKTVQYRYNPFNVHEPLADHIDPSVRKMR
jgi:hypothetical protein